MDLPTAEQATMQNAVRLACQCEERAIALDPIIEAARSGRPPSPYEMATALEGWQQLARQIGQHIVLDATLRLAATRPPPLPPAPPSRGWWSRWWMRLRGRKIRS